MRILPSRSGRSPSLGTALAELGHAYTRAELVSRWSRRQLDAAVSSRAVTRMLTGIYCGTDHAHNPVVQAEALTLWQPSGVVTGSAALHLRTPRMPPPSHIDYLVPHGLRLAAPGWVRLHQSPPPSHRMVAQGVFCTEMPRALLDAWRYSPVEFRRDVLWSALWARACTVRELERELERTSRLAGRSDFERLLAWFREGATSPLEVRAKHETFADARFREFEWQVRLPLRGRPAYVDMMHRRARVAVELDGDHYHATRDQRDDDRSRQAELAAAGYLVIRFGWNDITRRPAWCRDRLLRAVAAQLELRKST